jgi:hypothetical protein
MLPLTAPRSFSAKYRSRSVPPVKQTYSRDGYNPLIC